MKNDTQKKGLMRIKTGVRAGPATSGVVSGLIGSSNERAISRGPIPPCDPLGGISGFGG